MIKRKKIIIVFIIFIIGIGSVIGIFIWQNQKEVTIDEILHEYVKDYSVISQQENGETEIVVEAPDFTDILSDMTDDFDYEKIDDFDYEKISIKDINNEIKKKTTTMKDYTLSVKKLDEETIIESLSSQISYELLMQSIEKAVETECS